MDEVNKDGIDIFHSNEHEELYTFKEHQRYSLEQLKVMCTVSLCLCEVSPTESCPYRLLSHLCSDNKEKKDLKKKI